MKCLTRNCNEDATFKFCSKCSMKVLNHNYKVLCCDKCGDVLEISESETFVSSTDSGKQYLNSNKYIFTTCKKCGGDESSFVT